MRERVRCPYCGGTVGVRGGLTTSHFEADHPGPARFLTLDNRCPGSRQNPRALTDARPTWRDEDRAGVKLDPYAGVRE